MRRTSLKQSPAGRLQAMDLPTRKNQVNGLIAPQIVAGPAFQGFWVGYLSSGTQMLGMNIASPDQTRKDQPLKLNRNSNVNRKRRNAKKAQATNQMGIAKRLNASLTQENNKSGTVNGIEAPEDSFAEAAKDICSIEARTARVCEATVHLACMSTAGPGLGEAATSLVEVLPRATWPFDDAGEAEHLLASNASMSRAEDAMYEAYIEAKVTGHEDFETVQRAYFVVGRTALDQLTIDHVCAHRTAEVADRLGNALMIAGQYGEDDVVRDVAALAHVRETRGTTTYGFTISCRVAAWYAAELERDGEAAALTNAARLRL